MGQMTYSTDYTIYTPQLKSDDGRPLRVNPRLGNFTYEFSPHVLARLGLHAVSFCFFILWDGYLTGRLNRRGIWLKKELSISGSGIINLSDRQCFDRKFFAEEPLSVVRDRQALFSRYGLEASYWLLRDLKKDFRPTPSQPVAVQVTYDSARERLVKTPVSLERLQALLVENSNGHVHINKPLYYYETDLEKYLQTTCPDTGALFPGDCDLLLYDDTHVCQFILEFKKTTSRDSTPMKDQSFLNYIHKDRNKYTRLNILRNCLSQTDGRTIPFVTVFYSVRAGQEDQVKLERIGPSLGLERSALFSIGPDPEANQELLLRQVLALCGDP